MRTPVPLPDSASTGDVSSDRWEMGVAAALGGGAALGGEMKNGRHEEDGVGIWGRRWEGSRGRCWEGSRWTDGAGREVEVSVVCYFCSCWMQGMGWAG